MVAIRRLQILLNVQAAVSLTWGLESPITSIRRDSAWLTSGVRTAGSGPSRMDPKVMLAASRWWQSTDLSLASIKGVAAGTIASWTAPASRARQVLDAIATFHSSPSASSTCWVSNCKRTGIILGRAILAKNLDSDSGTSPYSCA